MHVALYANCFFIIALYGYCRLPFLKEKMSDEVTFAPCVIETLSLLGRIANTSPNVRQHIISSVRTLYEGSNSDEVEIPAGMHYQRLSA